ncbi:MAG: acetyl-CoA hydrolase/transferase C-terminal domain-containing protein [Peptoniphilaceae bacterium]|nr:4-hydroxybutyrate CoA-transferase [Peptoniphilaceae bacterium]MCI6660134.1 4-hydroxybutyrate CoA-transferase [Peptoniphilaceae bacterium]MDD7433451.1 acetyl-CoA hydrolase/transferase C-terminal domain-containing protein [Peptoniphilaceae bacterium]MDD7543606.1 acetyl-CoA hydrolase/transferase C-terminal domain-containing protein [Peptoniphilaceae bacterium]MDY3076217.1 acetyl-CoA hydrolase/transferase C-terminal domain-containing protein [Peptoniphilaceae bacterium]
MSDWKAYYQEHLTSAEEAVKRIQSGNRVVVEHACGEPSYLLEAMVANAAAYRDVEIVHMVAMGKAEYCLPQYQENFRHNAIFVGGSSRKAVEEGRADYTPCFFFEVPRLFSTTLPVDVAMVTVTPPDENGMCSLGVSVDYTMEAVKQAKVVLAQVNRNMPYTGPYSLISVEDVTCFVEHDAPIIELPQGKIGDIERAIGENCAKLIEDGDTLQLGIGAIPDAVLLFLKDKKDLGIHSEMFSDGVVKLVEAGVITNKKKTLNPGKFVVTFLMGTRALYDFVDHNDDVELRPVDYVNNPYVIAQNDHLISINSAVQVDLMGQTASESIGPKQISGVGGQVDFIRGASASKGGKAIIAMPSTVKGKVSKIVADLDDGAAVTTSRNDIDYVVTEYGIAALKGHTLKERARALIEIAHPDFRDELKAEFEKRFHCAYHAEA